MEKVQIRFSTFIKISHAYHVTASVVLTVIQNVNIQYSNVMYNYIPFNRQGEACLYWHMFWTLAFHVFVFEKT